MGSKYLSALVAVVLSLLIMLLMQTVEGLTEAVQNQTAAIAPALIVFGDSIVDPGNNNVIETMIKCNFPPYGQDFLNHQPTGRFSNGKVPSDLLVSELGIKEYLPAYLGTDLSADDLLTGVSFASGGCGYDPLTAQLVSAISMDDQLDHFKEYMEKLKAIAGEERAAFIIAESRYMVVTGSDDLANTYFTAQIRKEQYDLPSYINFLVRSASSFFQELYELGARKIDVLGVPPIGCLPSQRTLAGGIERECVPLYNAAANMLNGELSVELQRLTSTSPGSRIRYIDIYTPLFDIISRPSAYGFVEYARGCCGTGTFEVTMTCNSLTTTICEDVYKYVFWDSYHPTERTYKILISQLLQRYGKA
ncbi:uncharacterized protein M6B38_312395 [Iris pallida]|uniref:GDSL esterase/lipase EXL3 n=1 Tax=Iris pallida TaxID=29817 RepID=A0AAX6HGP1_IRIPA|nr:uncharacterized protein M6B38_312395 [Iris pallida]